MAQQGPETRSVLKIVGIVVLSGVALVIAWLLREPLSWIFLAGFIAAAVSGPVNFMTRYMKRGFAITIMMLALILVPIGLSLIVLPPVVNGAVGLAEKAPEYAQRLRDRIQNNPDLQNADAKYQISAKIQDKASEIPSKLGDAAGTLADIGAGLFNSLAAIATILVMTVFMLGGAHRWIDWIIRQQPRNRQARLRRVLLDSNRAIGNYLAGNIAISFVAGVSAYIVMLILDIPFAAPLAVTVAVLDLIPMIGSLIAGVVVGVVTLFVGFPGVTIAWAIWMLVYQQVENNLIQPQVQKRSVDINPLVVIISVLFGSTLFGIVGALLAIPLAAMIQIILKDWWNYRHPSPARSRKAAA